jgi:hypothetical protein
MPSIALRANSHRVIIERAIPASPRNDNYPNGYVGIMGFLDKTKFFTAHALYHVSLSPCGRSRLRFQNGMMVVG